MAFIELGDRRVQTVRSRITASVVVPRTGRHELHVRLGIVICDYWRWKAGDRVKVYWGTRDDFGMLALRVGTEGAVQLTRKSPSSLYLVSRQLPKHPIDGLDGAKYVLPPQSRASVNCVHQDLPDGRLAIRLPLEWFEQVGSKIQRVA